MTVTSESNIKRFTGNGSAVLFVFDKKIFLSSNLVITLLDSATGVATTSVLNGGGTYDYTMVVAGDNESANITFTTAPLSTHSGVMERIAPFTQQVNLEEADSLPVEPIEEAMDKLVLLVQQIQDSIDRSFKFATATPDIGTVEVLDIIADRADKLVGFDASGDLTLTENIVGPTGPTGPTGATGATGPAGADGSNSLSRGALVHRLSQQTIANNTTTLLLWTDEEYDTDSIHSTSVNPSRLTVPAGVTKVMLSANVSWAAVTGGRREAIITKNGSSAYPGRARVFSNPVDDGRVHQGLLSPVLNVSSGDYFEVSVFQNQGGNVNTQQINIWFAMAIVI